MTLRFDLISWRVSRSPSTSEWSMLESSVSSGVPSSRSRIGSSVSSTSALARVRNLLLCRVGLEVRGAGRQVDEPAAKGLLGHVLEAQGAPERPGGERLSELGDEVDLAPAGEGVDQLVRERRDHLVRVVADRGDSERRDR